MRSPLVNPGVVEEYLKKEVWLGHVVGLFNPDVLPREHMSCFGIIPKSHLPSKWRLILESECEGQNRARAVHLEVYVNGRGN